MTDRKRTEEKLSLAASNSPWADTVLDYTQSRNDMYARTQCSCGKTIRLAGYDDSNFFDRVHAQPHERTCECGQSFRYQWWRDGVAFAFASQATNKMIPPSLSGYSPRFYRGFIITHEHDGYWRIYSGEFQRGYARSLTVCKRMIEGVT